MYIFIICKLLFYKTLSKIYVIELRCVLRAYFTCHFRKRVYFPQFPHCIYQIVTDRPRRNRPPAIKFPALLRSCIAGTPNCTLELHLAETPQRCTACNV